MNVIIVEDVSLRWGLSDGIKEHIVEKSPTNATSVVRGTLAETL